MPRVCCFSEPSTSWFRRAPRLRVSETRIFARSVGDGRQALAYDLRLDTSHPVALILPLPTSSAAEDALRFVDLSRDTGLFDALAALFEPPMQWLSGDFSASRSAPLAVHDVGSFVASFVPTARDFSRLDRRFRAPRALFDARPEYADHGFAVFQLKPGHTKVHPMAFTFPTRAPSRLFFPTVHVHHGSLPATAEFDHALYYQANGEAPGDERAPDRPTQHHEGLVLVGAPVARRSIRGVRPNADTWIELG